MCKDRIGGEYLDVIFKNRNMTIRVACSQETLRERIEEIDGWNRARDHRMPDDLLLMQLLESNLCNSELETIQPEDCGALTDSLLFTIDCNRDDHGNITYLGLVYWDSAYMVTDYRAELLAGRDIVFEAPIDQDGGTSYFYDGYCLHLRDTGNLGQGAGRDNKVIVAYHLLDPHGNLIFDGSDLYASPLHDPESRETAAACLSLLTFESDSVQANRETENTYTDRQLAFLHDEWEALSMWPIELEEGENE